MPAQLYTVLLSLALPLFILRLLWRSVAAPAYRQRIAERFGRVPFAGDLDPARPRLWLHAVSVGEVAAAAPLVAALRSSRPELEIIVTTTTPTGSARVLREMGDSVRHCYAPYDHPWLIDRFLEQAGPRVLLIMETELWPNTIRCCARRHIGIMLANGRLSEKSARGYRRLPGMTRDMLARIDTVAVQSAEDGQRLRELGAMPERIRITGSLKFNASLSDTGAPGPPFSAILHSDRPVWVAASTREGEEPKLFMSHRQLLKEFPSALLIIVPRHPERFSEVHGMAERQGLTVQRRSQLQVLAPEIQVLLGDSMGELSAYYRTGSVAFVGGSLVATGCQNVVEPASLGLPVLTGPSQYNFAAICSAMEAAGGLRTVADNDALTVQLAALLKNEKEREAMGRAARALVLANQEALPNHLALLGSLLDAGRK